MSLWDDGRRWLGGKGELPDPLAPVDPRELEGRINDLRALLAASTRQLEALAGDEERLGGEEAELVQQTKAALKAGDRAKAGGRAVELDKVRKALAHTRETAASTRVSHDRAEAIAQAYEKALEVARPKKPAPSEGAPAPEPPPPPAGPTIVARARPPSPLVDFDARELAEQAYSAARRTVAWLRDLVELAPAGEGLGPGQASFESGDHERTIAECTRVLAREPRNAVACCNRGASLAMLGKPEEALGDYDRAIELDPRHALSWSNRADAKLTLDDHEGSIADATEALRLDPGLALARFNRGRAESSLGLWAAARDDFAESMRLAPGHALSHAHLAVAVLALGDPGAAIASASRALRADSKLAFAYRGRAQARLAAGTSAGKDKTAAARELEGALEDIDSAMREGGAQPGDRALRARILHARGDSRGALAEVEAEVSGDEDESVKVLARARWLTETNDLRGVLRELGDALERGLPPVPLLVLRGEALSRAGDHEAALADLSRAVELEPRSGPAREARGRAHFGAREPLLAFQDAEVALEVGHEAALDVRGFARWELGDLAGAVRDLELALVKNPTHDAAHEALGRCRAALGERSKARRSFERAVELEPGRAHALLWSVALGADKKRLAALAMGGEWLAHLARLVRGDESPESVLELAALAGDDGDVRERLCDAHAFAGLLREDANDPAGALGHYEASFATQAEGASEHAWVRARLARERARVPLADGVRLEKLGELGVLTPEEHALARRYLDEPRAS